MYCVCIGTKVICQESPCKVYYIYIYIYIYMQDLRFQQWCCLRYESPGMLKALFGWILTKSHCVISQKTLNIKYTIILHSTSSVLSLVQGCTNFLKIYRVSIKSFPDDKHLLQENYMEDKHFFFQNVTQLKKFFLQHISVMVKKYVCIPRSFLVINVCNKRKILFSPCRNDLKILGARRMA